MERFLNGMKGLANSQAQMLGQPRIGIVTSYNPNDGTAKVTLQPEGVQTGWLPVASLGVGSGWGVHIPLKGGEQVVVVCQEGDADNGLIVGRHWSNDMQPPNASGQDVVLQSSTGSRVTLSTNGNVGVVAKGTATLQDGNGSEVSITNDGNMTITCSGTLTLSAATLAVNATTAATITSPKTTVSAELDVTTGPIKQAGTVVVVP